MSGPALVRSQPTQRSPEKRSAGLADNWLRHIEDIGHKHAAWLDGAADDEDRGVRLAELT